MNEQDYITERVDAQQRWYSKNSTKNKRYFIIFALIEAVSAILIPFIIVVSETYSFPDKILVSLLGIITAISLAISSLNKFQENWVQYRTTSEQLKHEKYLYLTRTRPYNIENAFQIYVERNELIISKENSKWLEMVEHQEPTENTM